MGSPGASVRGCAGFDVIIKATRRRHGCVGHPQERPAHRTPIEFLRVCATVQHPVFAEQEVRLANPVGRQLIRLIVQQRNERSELAEDLLDLVVVGCSLADGVSEHGDDAGAIDVFIRAEAVHITLLGRHIFRDDPRESRSCAPALCGTCQESQCEQPDLLLGYPDFLREEPSHDPENRLIFEESPYLLGGFIPESRSAVDVRISKSGLVGYSPPFSKALNRLSFPSSRRP